MDSLSSVSPSAVLSPSNSLLHHHRRLSISVSSHPINNRLPSLSSFPSVPCSCGRRFVEIYCRSTSGRSGEEGKRDDDDGEDELDRAFRMDGTVPGSSNEFVERVSSRAYDMRRHLQQTVESSSYDVLENNPWRETSKALYVLTQRENQLLTMKTRRKRSEVEREFGMLFSKGGKLRPEIGSWTKQPRRGTKFQMFVEDVTEGILVFEDETEAAKYCDLLREGPGCEGVAEIEASSVFDLCKKMKALAVLFRRGRTPPVPESLQQNLRARKRSIEDQEDLG